MRNLKNHGSRTPHWAQSSAWHSSCKRHEQSQGFEADPPIP